MSITLRGLLRASSCQVQRSIPSHFISIATGLAYQAADPRSPASAPAQTLQTAYPQRIPTVWCCSLGSGVCSSRKAP